MSVNHIPDGMHSITPTLCVDDGKAAIEFYKNAFGATDVMDPMTCPSTGKIIHAEMKIGNSVFFLCEELEQFQTQSPKTLGGSPAWMYVYFENVDDQFKTAVDAGATSIQEPQEMFWGDRNGMILDPFGYKWSLSQHVEDLTPEEIGERMAEAFSQPQ